MSVPRVMLSDRSGGIIVLPESGVSHYSVTATGQVFTGVLQIAEAMASVSAGAVLTLHDNNAGSGTQILSHTFPVAGTYSLPTLKNVRTGIGLYATITGTVDLEVSAFSPL